MQSKLSLLLILLVVALVGHSAADHSGKPREKRSPKPQIGKLIGGLIARWGPKAVSLAQKAKKAVVKNPGKTAAGSALPVIIVWPTKGKDPKRCIVNIRRDLPDQQPVFIKDGTPRSLMVPTDGNLTWTHGETSWIACPPSARTQNSISGTNSIVQSITCDEDLNFYMNGQVVNIGTITCAQKVTGNVENRTDQQCVGTSKAIGFNVPFLTGYQFFDLFHSCFDETGANPLYTRHTLYGNEIDHKCIYRGSRPSFKTAGFPNGLDVDTAYTQPYQQQRLTDLFSVQTTNRNPQADAQYYYDVSYLQRGHLNPDGDQLFTTWQWSTYFFINVVGMWHKINTGNWKNLEDKVRTFASDKGVTLDIYTGTYGTLSLCSRTSNYCPDFTLINDRVAVPKWLWKIVKAPNADAAIALVVSNNPFQPVNRLCGSNQYDYGWYQNGFNNVEAGAVSYCTVQELQNAVGYIPAAAMATKVLTFV